MYADEVQLYINCKPFKIMNVFRNKDLVIKQIKIIDDSEVIQPRILSQQR